MLPAFKMPAPTARVLAVVEVRGIVIVPETDKVTPELMALVLLSVAESKVIEAHAAFAVTVTVRLPPPMFTISPATGELAAAAPVKLVVDQVVLTFQLPVALEK